MKKCDFEHHVDDASFGYWHESWGDSPVHVFKCNEHAVVTITSESTYGPGVSTVSLCTEHLHLA